MTDQEKKIEQEQETEQESERKRRRAIIIAALILLLIVGVTIGYAGLSSTLKINGTTEIKDPDWKICFTQVRVASNSVAASLPATISSSDCTEINYRVQFEYPGDFYEFDADVKNFSGKKDALVSSEPVLSGLSAEDAKYFTYTVNYKDGSEIKTNDRLNHQETKTYTVRIEYKDTLTEEDLPNVPETLNLSFKVPYTMAN